MVALGHEMIRCGAQRSLASLCSGTGVALAIER
ncbi:MAG: hypothetical protein JNK52_11070 [Zoogloeaceae bacterium]|nr:hypothetical protein [Zoogloeaceae bacterium]